MGEESFENYFRAMPWLAVPYSSAAVRKELSLKFEVGGIPSLILVNKENVLITDNARAEVNQDTNALNFPWHPKMVDELTEKHAARLNTGPCLILFIDGSEKEIEWAEETLLAVASENERKLNKLQEPQEKLGFFYAIDSMLSDHVRD